MNHALRRISLVVLAMFLLLLLSVNYVQAFEPSSLAVQRGNARTFSQQYQYQRGSIVTADNKTIADSVHVKGIYSYQRVYPDPLVYAPVTGYDSLYSASGIEQAEDKFLSGSDPQLTVHNLIDLVTGKPKRGATVQLTINSAAQTAAYDGAQGERAARRRGRDRPVDRRDPRHGVLPDLQPEQVRDVRQRPAQADRQPLPVRAQPAAAQPGHRRRPSRPAPPSRW